MTPVGSDRPDHRLHATLASGGQLVPGVSLECTGPDPYGAYSCAPAGAALPCAGATWHYRGEDDGTERAFVFRPGLSVCPVAILDRRSGRLRSKDTPEHARCRQDTRPGQRTGRLHLRGRGQVGPDPGQESLLSYPGDAERAARAIRAALGWSIQRARWFIQVK